MSATVLLCFVLQQSESTLFLGGASGAPVPILMHHHSGGDSVALLSVVFPRDQLIPRQYCLQRPLKLNKLSNINNCWSGRFQMDLHKFCPALASKTLSSFPFFTGFCTASVDSFLAEITTNKKIKSAPNHK